jgi:solute carrier family 25 carnitine/acylcarnitine transporter 20/29
LFAGTLYWLAIFPVDVVKSAMMSDAVLPSERKYKSVGDCVSQLMKEGGVPRFFR